jgi:hypothetical protein
MVPRSQLHPKQAADLLSQTLSDINEGGDVGWCGVSAGEYSALVVGRMARLQWLVNLQGYLDEEPFKRVCQLLDQLQTLAVPECHHVCHA